MINGDSKFVVMNAVTYMALHAAGMITTVNGQVLLDTGRADLAVPILVDDGVGGGIGECRAKLRGRR